MFKFLIFDFDGTLVHTAPDVLTAANEFLQKMGQPPRTMQQVQNNIGRGLRELILGLVPEWEHQEAKMRDAEQQILSIYDRHILNSPQFYEGVEEILALKDIQFAIVSNKREHYVRKILRHLGMAEERFVLIAGGDTYPHKKPHPIGLSKALEAAGRTVDETLMVGDGLPDILAAKELGMKSAAVSFGYGKADQLMQAGGHFLLHSIADLKPLLRIDTNHP